MMRPVLGLFRGVQDGAESWLQAFLDRSKASTFFAVALAGAVLAYVTTSSVYVKYDDSSGNQVYSLMVEREGSAWSRKFDVSENKPIQGTRFFLQLNRSYEFTDIQPPIFRPIRSTVDLLWPTIHLDVPGQLLMKDQSAFRLFPEMDLRLAGVPTRLDIMPSIRYDLVLTNNTNGRSDTFKDVRFRTILIAADSAVLSARRASEGKRFKEQLDGRIEDLLEVGATDSTVRVWRASWEADTTWFTPILEIGEGSHGGEVNITIEIIREGSRSPVLKKDFNLSPPSPEEIQTIILTTPEGTQR
jgi:hypothetical protein